MKDSEFLFDFVDLLYYHCHKINPSCGESYKDSLDWIKKDNSKFHHKKDNKCFQYTVTVALN